MRLAQSAPGANKQPNARANFKERYLGRSVFLCFVLMLLSGVRATDYFLTASTSRIGMTPEIIGVGT